MWDIVYAVDASSSMGEQHPGRGGSSFVKIETVEKSIVDLVAGGAFPVGSRLGVVTFHAQTRAGGLLVAGGQEMATVVVPLTETEALTPEGLRSRLSTIKVGGATPTGVAIEEGLRQLYASEEGALKRIKKLVVITDERSNVGPKPEKVVSDEVAVRAIIDVIAIGGRINKETLEKVASKTGGRFAVVEGSEQLIDAMKPRIELKGPGSDAPLLEEASKSAKELEGAKEKGTASMEYRQALERARQVRAKVNKRLMSLLLDKSKAEGEVKELEAKLKEGMPMKDYAARLWPRASELEQVQRVEKELRGAMEKLAA